MMAQRTVICFTCHTEAGGNAPLEKRLKPLLLLLFISIQVEQLHVPCVYTEQEKHWFLILKFTNMKSKLYVDNADMHTFKANVY